LEKAEPKISDYGGSVNNVVISNFNQHLDKHKKGFIAQASDVGSGIPTSFNVLKRLSSSLTLGHDKL